MIVFYTRNISGASAILEAEEARHATQVLRKKQGDTIRFTDGEGGWYEGTITAVSKGQCEVLISESEKIPYRRPYRLHLAVAPTKNIERFEWFLEKATEIGVDRITPVWCRHSERGNIRPERLQKVLAAAMKQSLQPFLPLLEPAIGLEQLLRQEQDSLYGRYIAYMATGDGYNHLFEACVPGQDTLVLIGPEGDFSAEEVAHCVAAGFSPVSLGRNRLRTETAAVAAAHCVALRNDLSY
jgi:16S rRNA (uracil1498-N3)-methyltransferase